tara:strand:+ start:25350 stop:25988 length:639 start_codon:yes stop_codon:yes gene_type:complete
MYFRRVRRLDLPASLAERILNEVTSDRLIPTGMKESTPQDNPSVNYNLNGAQLNKKLSDDIYSYYDEFLKMVPDAPKIIIKRITSTVGGIPAHTDKGQTSTFTCVISGGGAETIWYEPTADFLEKYREADGARHRYKKAVSAPESELRKVTSITLQPWEMILFDHNALHSVSNVQRDSERILFSIGFLNITQTELEDIYDEWYIKNKKDQMC